MDFRALMMATVFTCVVSDAVAQQCAIPARDTTGAVQEDAVPWLADEAFAVLQDVLRDLRYRIASTSTDEHTLRTGVNRRPPRSPLMQTFRNYPYPGIEILGQITTDSTGTHLRVEARAVCGVAGEPPPGYDSPVEESLETIAVMEVTEALIERMRRSRSRVRGAVVADAPTPPVLLECRQPAPSDSILQRTRGGRVIVRGVVDTTGRFASGRLAVVSSTHPDLEGLAVELAASCRFRPGMKDGRPINVLIELPLDVGR